MKDEGQRWDFLSQSCGIDGYFIVAQSDYIARNLNINYIIYILVLVVIAAGNADDCYAASCFKKNI